LLEAKPCWVPEPERWGGIGIDIFLRDNFGARGKGSAKFSGKVRIFDVMCNHRVDFNDLMVKGVPGTVTGTHYFQKEIVSMDSDSNRAR